MNRFYLWVWSVADCQQHRIPHREVRSKRLQVL